MFPVRNKHFVIGVSGGSGSGKTFFLKCLLNHFNSSEVCLISQDDYYFPVEGLTAEENKLHNFDLPSAINEKQFLDDIDALLNGNTVYKEQYNFNNTKTKTQVLEINPASVIVIEGLFIFHFPEIFKLLDLKIFIEADVEIALQRRINRDFVERGYSHDDVLFKWQNHVIPAFNTYLLPYKQCADKNIFNNSNVAEDILKVAEEISHIAKNSLKNISQ